MTAKEKQAIVIKEYLKPTLKRYGYLTNSLTWWQEEADFYKIISLQNFSWNTKDEVEFCFNIGIALKSEMKDPLKKPTYADFSIQVREGYYLPNPGKDGANRSLSGYVIKKSTKLEKFTEEIKSDFESSILTQLDGLKTLDDCMGYYGELPVWGDYLKRIITKTIADK